MIVWLRKGSIGSWANVLMIRRGRGGLKNMILVEDARLITRNLILCVSTF
jgi:hypothetical protein